MIFILTEASFCAESTDRMIINTFATVDPKYIDNVSPNINIHLFSVSGKNWLALTSAKDWIVHCFFMHLDFTEKTEDGEEWSYAYSIPNKLDVFQILVDSKGELNDDFLLHNSEQYMFIRENREYSQEEDNERFNRIMDWRKKTTDEDKLKILREMRSKEFSNYIGIFGWHKTGGGPFQRLDNVVDMMSVIIRPFDQAHRQKDVLSVDVDILKNAMDVVDINEQYLHFDMRSDLGGVYGYKASKASLCCNTGRIMVVSNISNESLFATEFSSRPWRFVADRGRLRVSHKDFSIAALNDSDLIGRIEPDNNIKLLCLPVGKHIKESREDTVVTAIANDKLFIHLFTNNGIESQMAIVHGSAGFDKKISIFSNDDPSSEKNPWILTNEFILENSANIEKWTMMGKDDTIISAHINAEEKQIYIVAPYE